MLGNWCAFVDSLLLVLIFGFMLGTVEVQQDGHAEAKQQGEKTQEAEAGVLTLKQSEASHLEWHLLRKYLEF